MVENRTADGFMTGQLLVAMPGMQDPRFIKTVIYMCAHNADGAMGLVINRALGSLTFADLLEQLGVEHDKTQAPVTVHFGGPVESGRGFVLHTADYVREGTLVVDGGIALTATVDILRAIAGGDGPRGRLLALGYAGWAPGQLENEMRENGWLMVDADEKLVFDSNLDAKWERALGKLGIDVRMLSSDAGHA